MIRLQAQEGWSWSALVTKANKSAASRLNVKPLIANTYPWHSGWNECLHVQMVENKFHYQSHIAVEGFTFAVKKVSAISITRWFINPSDWYKKGHSDFYKDSFQLKHSHGTLLLRLHCYKHLINSIYTRLLWVIQDISSNCYPGDRYIEV